MSGLSASPLDPMAVERQRLTIEDARSTYGLDGAFDEALARWWVLVEDRMPDISRSVLVKQSGGGSVPSDAAVARRVAYAKGKLAADVDQTWLDRMVGMGAAMASADQSHRDVTAGLLSAYSEMHRVLFQVVADPGELQMLSWAMLQLALVESDIVASEMTEHVEALAHKQLEVRTELFRTELTNAAKRMDEATSRISVAVRATAETARRLLDEADLMSSTANASAAAMEQARAGSARLVIAIDTARTEVSQCAAEAARAAMTLTSSTEAAVQLADLSGLVQSVLATLHDIAQRTKLIALNATIEAAHAGVNGRSFAVVAQEVKGLANGASNSTTEISNTLSEIKNRVSLLLESANVIGLAVNRVTESSTRTEQELSRQDPVVTDIVEAISQTSEGIDRTSRAASELRHDLAILVSEMDEAEQIARDMAGVIAGLEANGSTFLSAVAKRS